MANKPETKPSRTTQVPVITMEEVPVLTDTERAELLTSLQEAERDIKAGRGIDYNPKSFKDRLLGIYRRAKRWLNDVPRAHRPARTAAHR